MIPFQREAQQSIPESSVKIIGVGGAGANMLDRVALDGMEGAELLVANTDVRTLTSSVASEKIQIGQKLTKGLGTGGDPDLGRQAVTESEDEIRAALKGRAIVFICVGLGGGTGSGAAPTITRIAREEGAFTVVFATMPFSFEGQRRRDQASTSLNELAALSNAIMTFDNGRMGELVLAKQGIHDAFGAADRLISESIKAVTRLVIRPGLINVGLDDLMSSLNTTRSRCLFGSGLGRGESRSQNALESALSSPLLNRGSLLSDAQSVLVHICGGEDMTLYEIELLMRGLTKHVPESAHILFGAAVDPAMKDSLSVTLISSLPEERLIERPYENEAKFDEVAPIVDVAQTKKGSESEKDKEESDLFKAEEELEVEDESEEQIHEKSEKEVLIEEESSADIIDSDLQEIEDVVPELEAAEEDPISELESEIEEEESEVLDIDDLNAEKEESGKDLLVADAGEEEKEGGKIPQQELSFDGAPRGKFEGEGPNIIDGEDLDIPAFLRNKK